jgi:PAS domain S-box-containing protein
MSDETIRISKQAALRLKAISRMNGHPEPAAGSPTAPPAYEVLHKLALSPSTAADALALLHELQVHQVELELQAEEMRDSYASLETVLHRQRQLYEAAPVGYFTVDSNTILADLNSAGSQLLRLPQELLLGQHLNSFLLPDSARNLQTRILDVAAGQQVDTFDLQLVIREGGSRTVHASISADSDGVHYLVAFMLANTHHPESTERSTL